MFEEDVEMLSRQLFNDLMVAWTWDGEKKVRVLVDWCNCWMYKNHIYNLIHQHSLCFEIGFEPLSIISFSLSCWAVLALFLIEFWSISTIPLGFYLFSVWILLWFLFKHFAWSLLLVRILDEYLVFLLDFSVAAQIYWMSFFSRCLLLIVSLNYFHYMIRIF